LGVPSPRSTAIAKTSLDLLPSHLTLQNRQPEKESRITMGAIQDAAESAAENAVYQKGGYPALIQYKAARFFKTYCGCCA